MPVCSNCCHPFDSSDRRFDGRARHRDTPWCRGCFDRHTEGTHGGDCALCAAELRTVEEALAAL